jgi:hypothetical protein
MDSHVATSVKASPAPAKSAATATSAKFVAASTKSVSAAGKSSPTIATAAVILRVPSPTTSSSASHTPSFDIPITPMEVEEVEYGSKDVEVVVKGMLVLWELEVEGIVGVVGVVAMGVVHHNLGNQKMCPNHL